MITQLAQRHAAQDDFTHAIGHLADWQQDLESGPDDNAHEWSERLSDVMEAQRLLHKLNAFLYSIPVTPEEHEETYGEHLSAMHQERANPAFYE